MKETILKNKIQFFVETICRIVNLMTYGILALYHLIVYTYTYPCDEITCAHMYIIQITEIVCKITSSDLIEDS